MKFNNSNDKSKYYCKGCSNLIHSFFLNNELYYCACNVNDSSKCGLNINNRYVKHTKEDR